MNLKLTTSIRKVNIKVKERNRVRLSEISIGKVSGTKVNKIVWKIKKVSNFIVFGETLRI